MHNEYSPFDRMHKEADAPDNGDMEALRDVMKTPNGRRFVAHILNMTGIHSVSFRMNNEMAFLEGRRSVGLDLLSEIVGSSHEAYITLQKSSTTG